MTNDIKKSFWLLFLKITYYIHNKNKCRVFYVKNNLFIWNEIRQYKDFVPHYLLHSIMTNPILLNIKVHIESPERLIKMQKSHRNIDRKNRMSIQSCWHTALVHSVILFKISWNLRWMIFFQFSTILCFYYVRHLITFASSVNSSDMVCDVSTLNIGYISDVCFCT